MALEIANTELAAIGARVRISQVDWLTRTETGEVGQTVFFFRRGNKQSTGDFVPGDPRRGGRTNILYLVDQSDGPRGRFDECRNGGGDRPRGRNVE